MITNEFICWLLLIVGGYFLGSIMFCQLVCRAFFNTDLRKVSKDGNPGAANAFRYCGKLAGILGLLGDVLKGLVPVFLALKFLDYNNILFIFVMFAPVLGHAFPIFNGFSGGKCIATVYGELGALLITGVSPWLGIVLAVANIVLEFVVKPGGNKRAFYMFAVLILAAVPICIYDNQLTILVGVIAISVLAMFKHLPLYAADEVKTKKPRKSASRNESR